MWALCAALNSSAARVDALSAVTSARVLHGYAMNISIVCRIWSHTAGNKAQSTHLSSASCNTAIGLWHRALSPILCSAWSTTLWSMWQAHLAHSPRLSPSRHPSLVMRPASALRTLLPASDTKVGSHPVSLYFSSSFIANSVTTATPEHSH